MDITGKENRGHRPMYSLLRFVSSHAQIPWPFVHLAAYMYLSHYYLACCGKRKQEAVVGVSLLLLYTPPARDKWLGNRRKHIVGQHLALGVCVWGGGMRDSLKERPKFLQSQRYFTSQKHSLRIFIPRISKLELLENWKIIQGIHWTRPMHFLLSSYWIPSPTTPPRPLVHCTAPLLSISESFYSPCVAGTAVSASWLERGIEPNPFPNDKLQYVNLKTINQKCVL